jgi:quinol monooxygenase YgiN
MEIQTIWDYEVRDNFIGQFKDAYGPDGEWAKLYKKCSGYIKTDLLQDLDNPNRFITIDCWQSHTALDSMIHIVAPEYEYLEKRCEAFTTSENHIGIFELIDHWDEQNV